MFSLHLCCIRYENLRTLFIVLGTAKCIWWKKLSKWDRNTNWLLTLKDRVKKNQVFYKSIRWLAKVTLILISSPFHMPLSRMRSTCQASHLSHWDENTHRSWVSCWTSSCQCLLALSSALYIPLMCWITFFLSIPCDSDTACVMSPAILEMSLDFVSRRWKRLRRRVVF